MAAVDEHQAGVQPQSRRHVGRVTDHRDRHVLGAGELDRSSPERQRVDPARVGVDEAGVVVLPANLVLLRTAVVVDAEDERRPGAPLESAGDA